MKLSRSRCLLAAIATIVVASCKIEDRTPGSAISDTPSAPSAVNAPDGLVMGTAADADTLLVDVRSLDSTIVVDMRYRDSGNFTGAPLPGYEANRALLHRDAASALARVQMSLRAEGLSLKVFDAYRPARATNAMVDWAERNQRIDLVTNGYIADRSRHNLGVAIDCTLIDLATGEELDMGSEFDTFSNASHTANATGRAAVNRLRLVVAMAREGFSSYDKEWWHYSVVVPSPLRFDIPVR